MTCLALASAGLSQHLSAQPAASAVAPKKANSEPGRPRIAAAPGDRAPRPVSKQALVNLRAFAGLYGLVRYFHPSDQAAAADWNAIAIDGVERVESARGPAELAAALNAVFSPIAPTIQVRMSGREAGDLSSSAPPGAAGALRWRHRGMGQNSANTYFSTREGVGAVTPNDIMITRLSGGVTARLPLVVWRDARGASIPHSAQLMPPSVKPAGFVPSGFDRSTRLGAVIVAWSMFQHFYPYFDVVKVNWQRELDRALRSAALAPDDLQFLPTLERLVAALRDGHGHVVYDQPVQGVLPLTWQVIEGKLVITATAGETGEAKRGDIVADIDGRPAMDVLAELGTTLSGSPQWVRRLAEFQLRRAPPGKRVRLRLIGADGRSRNSVFSYAMIPPSERAHEARPQPIAELAPGILYVDLERVTGDVFRAKEADLAKARGLIFDLRGYPAGPPDFLKHLVDRPVRSAHFYVPTYLWPDQRNVTNFDGAWSIEPAAPRFTSNVIFVTDASALSYSESILGLIAGNKLADIVGQPSGGVNGNISMFDLPGRYRLIWTAMRVVNIDGSQHHLVGVRPTVPVRRTIRGVRAGRDEMLDRALAIAGSRAAIPAASAR